MSKDTITVNMNVYDIPIIVEQLNKLEQENKQLKEIEKEHQKINGELREELQKANDTLDTHNELINHLQDIIEEVREYTEELKPHWLGNDLVLKIIDDLLQILDKGVKDE